MGGELVTMPPSLPRPKRAVAGQSHVPDRRAYRWRVLPSTASLLSEGFTPSANGSLDVPNLGYFILLEDAPSSIERQEPMTAQR
jgi:hypothetical protein